MATRGKRLIFTDACSLPAEEYIATAAGILPGMSVQVAAAGVATDAQESTVAAPLQVADYDFLKAGDVDTAWANGTNVVTRQLESGKRANVLVAAGNNITSRKTPLARSGSGGTLKIAEAGDHVVATSDEIINVAGSAGLVRVRGV